MKSSPGLPPLAAYVHLPWCVRKCPYCDFNSHPQRADTRFDSYTDALLVDLQWSLRSLPLRPLRSIFFGGGTPSLCPPEQIGRILQALEHHCGFAPGIEITLEANPGTADAAHFSGYRQAGVNRLSIGVQSFANTQLQALGRIHSADQAKHAFELARSAGFENINLDLMHGLPGQSVQQALSDLDQALSLGPEHLSWYELTLEPNTEFARHPPTLPAEDTLAGIEELGRRKLRAAGFLNYEISAWARPGRRAQHNLNYWRYGDFLGLGAGAHSKLSLPDGRIQRLARQKAPSRYQSGAGGPEVLSQVHTLSPTDRLEEFLLNACRLRDGFSLALFERRSGLPRSALGPGLRAAAAQGLLRVQPEHLRPTALGRRHLNTLLACFAQTAAAE